MSDISEAFRTQAEADFGFIVEQEFSESVTHTAKATGTETTLTCIVERMPDEFETRDSGRVVISRAIVHASQSVAQGGVVTVVDEDKITIDSEDYGIESILNERDMNAWEIHVYKVERDSLQASNVRKIVL